MKEIFDKVLTHPFIPEGFNSKQHRIWMQARIDALERSKQLYLLKVSDDVCLSIIKPYMK